MVTESSRLLELVMRASSSCGCTIAVSSSLGGIRRGHENGNSEIHSSMAA